MALELTPREREVLEALVVADNAVAAARWLGIKHQSLRTILLGARKRNGLKSTVVLAYLFGLEDRS